MCDVSACMPRYLYEVIFVQTSCNTQSSSVVTPACPPMHHITSGIDFLVHFVSHILIRLGASF